MKWGGGSPCCYVHKSISLYLCWTSYYNMEISGVTLIWEGLNPGYWFLQQPLCLLQNKNTLQLYKKRNYNLNVPQIQMDWCTFQFIGTCTVTLQVHIVSKNPGVLIRQHTCTNRILEKHIPTVVCKLYVQATSFLLFVKNVFIILYLLLCHNKINSNKSFPSFSLFFLKHFFPSFLDKSFLIFLYFYSRKIPVNFGLKIPKFPSCIQYSFYIS